MTDREQAAERIAEGLRDCLTGVPGMDEPNLVDAVITLSGSCASIADAIRELADVIREWRP